jgi:Ca2+-binding EF-hand superfamily protein
MFFEEKIISENLLSREYIDELYHLFVNLCDNQRFKIIPLDFIQTFSNKETSVDKDIWNQIFFQIDYDKDGAISFQDFLRFTYNNLKLIFGEVDRVSYNRLMYLFFKLDRLLVIKTGLIFTLL